MYTSSLDEKNSLLETGSQYQLEEYVGNPEGVTFYIYPISEV